MKPGFKFWVIVGFTLGFYLPKLFNRWLLIAIERSKNGD